MDKNFSEKIVHAWTASDQRAREAEHEQQKQAALAAALNTYPIALGVVGEALRRHSLDLGVLCPGDLSQIIAAQPVSMTGDEKIVYAFVLQRRNPHYGDKPILMRNLEADIQDALDEAAYYFGLYRLRLVEVAAIERNRMGLLLAWENSL